jgi:hypothetical protein
MKKLSILLILLIPFLFLIYYIKRIFSEIGFKGFSAEGCYVEK